MWNHLSPLQPANSHPLIHTHRSSLTSMFLPVAHIARTPLHTQRKAYPVALSCSSFQGPNPRRPWG